MLCNYKNILGNPSSGIHKYRIFDLAIADILLTFLLAFAIHSYTPKYRFVDILIILFILGIVSHRLFCVRTTIDKLLFNTLIKPFNKSNRPYNIK